MTIGPLVEWNFHLGIAAGDRSVHSGDNAVNVAMDGGTLRIAQNDDRDTAGSQRAMLRGVPWSKRMSIGGLRCFYRDEERRSYALRSEM